MTIKGLATTVRHRLRRLSSEHVHVEVNPEPAVETPDPAVEDATAPVTDALTLEVRRFLEQLIVSRHSNGGPGTGNKFLHHDFNHLPRFVASLSFIPENPGRVLDPAAGNGMIPDLLRHFRNADVALPPYFDLEKQPVPYPDGSFDGVVLTEVIEHLTVDPMYAMSELNRVLRPGGFLLLTTPNIASWGAIRRLMDYETPYLYGVFERRPSSNRHNREYTVREVERLAHAAGFETERLETRNAYENSPNFPPIHDFNPADRGDTTFFLGRKVGPVVDRYPGWLYTNWGD